MKSLLTWLEREKEKDGGEEQEQSEGFRPQSPFKPTNRIHASLKNKKVSEWRERRQLASRYENKGQFHVAFPVAGFSPHCFKSFGASPQKWGMETAKFVKF